MKEAEFRKLVKKDLYQIFLFSCPTPIPCNIALHHWFVINKKGKISRWDVLDWTSNKKESWGHLNKNFLRPTAGFKKCIYGN